MAAWSIGSGRFTSIPSILRVFSCGVWIRNVLLKDAEIPLDICPPMRQIPPSVAPLTLPHHGHRAPSRGLSRGPGEKVLVYSGDQPPLLRAGHAATRSDHSRFPATPPV